MKGYIENKNYVHDDVFFITPQQQAGRKMKSMANDTRIPTFSLTDG